MNRKSVHYIAVTKEDTVLTFSEGGTFVVYFSNLSGTLKCVVGHRNAKVYLFGLYDMKGKDSFSVHTKQIHTSEGGFSQLQVLSVARDSSELHFSGLIRIEEGAQQSHAYQKNQNLILSSGAFVDSRPMLEINANDVFCTHGSTTGPIEEDQIAYALMRGIPRNKAEEAYVEGFKRIIFHAMEELGVHV